MIFEKRTETVQEEMKRRGEWTYCLYGDASIKVQLINGHEYHVSLENICLQVASNSEAEAKRMQPDKLELARKLLPSGRNWVEATGGIYINSDAILYAENLYYSIKEIR